MGKDRLIEKMCILFELSQKKCNDLAEYVFSYEFTNREMDNMIENLLQAELYCIDECDNSYTSEDIIGMYKELSVENKAVDTNTSLFKELLDAIVD